MLFFQWLLLFASVSVNGRGEDENVGEVEGEKQRQMSQKFFGVNENKINWKKKETKLIMFNNN